MPNTERLQFTIDIAAPVARVWDTMLSQPTYSDWTSAFAQGSTYEGSWEQGQRILFLGPDGNGMVSEIAENRRHAFLSIRHLGMRVDGKEDFDSPQVRAWTPAYENYTFEAIPGGTRLRVDQDMAPEYAQFMRDTWPKALARLKALSEGQSA